MLITSKALGLNIERARIFVGEKYNFMTSNIAKSLNNVLTMARDYPVISLLETL